MIAYLIHAAVVVGLLLAVAVGGIWTGRLSSAAGAWAYPAISWGGTLYLFVVALVLRPRGRLRLSTAALLLQALGIFSLMLGLGLGVLSAVRAVKSGEMDDLSSIAPPFVEGLIAVGLTTLLSSALRVSEDLSGRPVAEGGSFGSPLAPGGIWSFDPGLPGEVKALRRELEAAAGHAKALSGSLESTNVLIKNVGVLIEQFDKFFKK